MYGGFEKKRCIQVNLNSANKQQEGTPLIGRKYKDFELEGQKEKMGLLKDIFDKSIFSEEQRITGK